MTIYGQSWGRAAPGPRFRVGLSAAVARRAGAYGPRSRASDRPLRARHARRRLPCSPWARPRRGSTRARRRNKWARMPYEISECVGLRARPPAPGVGAGGRARPGSRTAAGFGVRAGNPGVGVVGWAGRAAGPRGLTAAAATDQEVRRSCPQAATGDRLGTPSADCQQLPGSREAGIASHAARRVCISSENVFASLPQVERGVSKVLGGDPKGDHFLYTNGKCVILRNIDVSTLCPAGPASVPALPATFRVRNSCPSSPPHLPISWPGEKGNHAPFAQEPLLGGSVDWTGLFPSTPTPTPLHPHRLAN